MNKIKISQSEFVLDEDSLDFEKRKLAQDIGTRIVEQFLMATQTDGRLEIFVEVVVEQQ